MTSPYSITLSAFADEVGFKKTAVEQLTALAAMGLQYYSPRFIDVSGSGETKHIMTLNEAELKTLKELHAAYGIHVTSIGSPIGKVKLIDKDDGTHNRYVPFADYLAKDVQTAIDRATFLETKLIRGFSFYQPRGDEPTKYLPQAIDQIGRIAEKCAAAGVVYGLEVEANLIGQNGRLLGEIAKQVNSPHMVLIFDGGNLSSQNLDVVECFAEYEAMRPYLGWLHIKDYQVDPNLPWTGVVEEERLRNFVPASLGDSGHERILRDLRQHLPELNASMQKIGAPGVFLELEPHLKGGGQFGGFSGPDGLGVACRSLCSILDYVQIDYELRTFEHIRKARGF
ncbi:MAG: Xylose isomerase-like barrel [Planctomycetaceae bacterium]|nr:Xylose isomerase-like barrel [Planctomycetaceae bacterium]